MILSPLRNQPTPHRSRRLSRAFTLTEMMIAMSIYIMVIGGVIYSNIVGAKMYQITKAKLGANDQARGAISTLIFEVRSARDLDVGNGTSNSFTQVAAGSAQQGNSLQIYTANNSTNYIRYFLDTNSATLYRMTNGSSTLEMVAETITNTVVFAAEDFRGNVLTNTSNNRVIALTLQFYQIRYPVITIGPSNYYDYYALRTKITRRAIQ